MDLQFITPKNPLWQEVLDLLPHDIYHIPQYVELEAKRYQATPEAVLIKHAGELFFLPYLVRRCGEELRGINSPADSHVNPNELGFDVVSPYGYPGILMSQSAIDHPDFLMDALTMLKVAWRDRKICSAFLRLHPSLNEHLLEHPDLEPVRTVSNTVSVDLSLDDAQMWSATRKGHRSGINKCIREGFNVRMTPVAESIDLFNQIYEETMTRVGASITYYSFNQDYLRDLHRAIGDRMHICLVEKDGRPAAAGLYSESCGIVQSLLGGTCNEYLSLSPALLETDFLRRWARDRGNRWLHLGGGVGGEHDSVYRSKSGFSKTCHPFITLRLVIDEHRYEALVYRRTQHLNLAPGALEESSYFPAYRAS
jgi:Acetyltransferase (GNAT) domain